MIPTEVLQWMAIFLIVMLLPLLAVNFVTNGLILLYFKVLMSRGKFILVELVSHTGSYFRTGTISGNKLQYKNRDPDKKQRGQTVLIPEGQQIVSRWLKVNKATLYEPTSTFLNPVYQGIKTNDPNKVDSLLTRIVMLPKRDEMLNQRLMVILVLVAIAAAGFAAFMAYQNNDALSDLKLLIDALPR